MGTPLWLSGGCQCSSRLVSDWHSRCNSSGWLGTAGYRDKQQVLTQARPGQGRGAGIGTRGASLTSLWGAEGPILAGGPQTPAVKGLYLQMVQAVGPQVSQDDAGGISGRQHVVFVDMPPAVLPLSALPPVRHLKVDRRPHRGSRGPAVTPGHMLAPVLTGTLSSKPKDFRESSWQVAEVCGPSCPSWWLHTSPGDTPSSHTLDPYIVSTEVTLDLSWVHRQPLDQHGA